MKLMSKTLLAGFVACVLSPLSALALPPDCDDICVEYESCDTTCAVPWSTRIITCGRWATEYHHPNPACMPSLAAEGSEEESLLSSEDAEEVDASWERAAQDVSAE